MAAGYHQEFDLFTDQETKEQAEIQRRELAERVQDFLMGKGREQPPWVEVTRLVRSYTVAFRTADGGNGMVLIWSAHNLALTFQVPGINQPPETDVFHTFDDLLKNLDKIFPSATL
jgi:hypothetical protein